MMDEKKEKERKRDYQRDYMRNKRSGVDQYLPVRAKPVEVIKAPKDSGKMREAIIQRLYERVIEKGDSQAAFRLAQMQGWILDKNEGTNKVNGDVIAKAILGAAKGLTEGGYGMADVQKELPILPEELCMDNGQGGEGDSEVEALAVST